MIPEHEQQNILDSFWIMLQECESKAEQNNDAVLKHWVNQWYQQINRITGKNHKPDWRK